MCLQDRAPSLADPAAVRARAAPGDVPAISADAAADPRSGRTAEERQRRVAHAEREGRTLAGLGIAPTAMEAVVPSYLWRFRKTGQFKTGGAEQRRLFPSASATRPSEPTMMRHQREQREAVALHVVEERLHHDPGDDERHREADGDQHRVARAHLGASLVEIVGEGARHGRHREPERELRRGAVVGAEQHGADDGGAGARHARHHGKALHEADHEIHRQREVVGIVVARLEIELVDHSSTAPPTISVKQISQRIEEHSLDEVVRERADDRRRQERDQHADDETPRRRIGEEADRERHSRPK